MATRLCSIRIYWYHYIGNLVLIPIMANRIYWYQYIGNLVLLLWQSGCIGIITLVFGP